MTYGFRATERALAVINLCFVMRLYKFTTETQRHRDILILFRAVSTHEILLSTHEILL